jgi:hypothetical protein
MNASYLLLGMLLFFPPDAPGQNSSRLDVHLVTDEADAVLAILAKKTSSAPIPDSDWQTLFQSEGYRRLKKRELAMQRPFEDAAFKSFVLAPELLARAPALRQTLDKWKQANMNQPAGLALAYLPVTAHIQASIYLVIKPQSNSFVFDLDKDPAIFLYLDPDISEAEFENTVAHELHHIGYGTACPPSAVQDRTAQQPANVQQLANWIGAFGEGFAMLAAAGGPEVHPHAASKREERERWDHDMANFGADQKELDRFFRRILSGELAPEQTRTQGFSYFGVQGPWYTVGWKIAVTIERAYGRAKLIEEMCNAPALLSTYNAAVSVAKPKDEALSLWSPEIIKALAPIAK